ncbi:Hypothetical predicted protein [Paramuricea clavata]|uniref:Uncharacterized protein n=1 Tax=Paramuricea clavata TaxID=317549 RepID=A0A6S7GFH7_PARCT|nr:Hypothetical predicted protein [Paramuricea clavata]
MGTIMDIKMRLWTSWIIVGLLGQLGDTIFRGECQSEGYFKAVRNNVRLKNYVISTRDVHSLQDCVSACLSDAHCSSYNFQVSGVPLHKCELNFKSRLTARPGSLVLDNGYQYYEITDSKEVMFGCFYYRIFRNHK